MRTDTGNNVGIGGFTITGGVPKHVLIRALGPSLTKFGFTAAEVLADPTLEVHGPAAFGTITNNNWRDSQEAQIKADGLPPTNDLESAIDATLPPGAYTALVKGSGGGAGICTFEVYDLDIGRPIDPRHLRDEDADRACAHDADAPAARLCAGHRVNGDGQRLDHRPDFRRDSLGQFVEIADWGNESLGHRAGSLESHDLQVLAHVVVSRPAEVTHPADQRGLKRDLDSDPFSGDLRAGLDDCAGNLMARVHRILNKRVVALKGVKI